VAFREAIDVDMEHRNTYEVRFIPSCAEGETIHQLLIDTRLKINHGWSLATQVALHLVVLTSHAESASPYTVVVLPHEHGIAEQNRRTWYGRHTCAA